jgi:hypothetical protein
MIVRLPHCTVIVYANIGWSQGVSLAIPAQGQTLDQRAELVSLGSVLYQMVAGRRVSRSGMSAVSFPVENLGVFCWNQA